jgi:adenylylsulfate kinase
MALDSRNLHNEEFRMQNRSTKEILLQQRAHVFWFYGLSGSGKTTLATALEQRLTQHGYKTKILDGDNIRGGLNSDLGFSDADREENIRRIAHVAKLFVDAGVVVICSFITPKRAFRELARNTVGKEVFQAVYTSASYETCEKRDVHGLYAKAREGKIANFTGHRSGFEPPVAGDTDWIIDTDAESEEESLQALIRRIQPMIEFESVIHL